MKEIEIIPSDKSIEEMYKLEKEFSDKLDLPIISYKKYYKKYKKPLRALFG